MTLINWTSQRKWKTKIRYVLPMGNPGTVKRDLKWGALTKSEECKYHPGKAVSKPKKGRQQRTLPLPGDNGWGWDRSGELGMSVSEAHWSDSQEGRELCKETGMKLPVESGGPWGGCRVSTVQRQRTNPEVGWAGMGSHQRNWVDKRKTESEKAPKCQRFPKRKAKSMSDAAMIK